MLSALCCCYLYVCNDKHSNLKRFRAWIKKKKKTISPVFRHGQCFPTSSPDFSCWPAVRKVDSEFIANTRRPHVLNRGQLTPCVCGGKEWWWLFPLLRGFRENVRSFIPRLCFFFFFFEGEISSSVLIPLFRPGSVHNGSAS